METMGLTQKDQAQTDLIDILSFVSFFDLPKKKKPRENTKESPKGPFTCVFLIFSSPWDVFVSCVWAAKELHCCC